MTSDVDISVIIPTYNEGHKLDQCLAALRAQSFKGTYEVLAVDNGSTRNIPEVPSDDPLVRLLREPTPGSYSARNAGVAVARGRILAFTDSDCLPQPEWLASAWQAFQEQPDTALLAGRVQIYFKDPEKPTAVELFERQYSFRQEDNVREGWAVTANLFVRRQVLQDIGAFNTDSFSGGDAEFTRRAVARGYRLGYLAAATVLHPARRELEELKQMRRRHVGGFFKLSTVRPEFSSMFSYVGIAKDLLYPLKGGILLARDVLARRVHAGEALRIFSVLAYIRVYRGLLKASYKFNLRQSFER